MVAFSIFLIGNVISARGSFPVCDFHCATVSHDHNQRDMESFHVLRILDSARAGLKEMRLLGKLESKSGFKSA